MRFFHVFLAVFLVMSCNDEKKDKLLDCSTNLKKECLVGNWKIKSAKLGEKGQVLADQTLTDPQKGQSLSIKDGKISGKILLVKADAIALGDNPITLTDTDYTFVENDKKITFNGPSGAYWCQVVPSGAKWC